MESVAGPSDLIEPPRPRAVTVIGRIWLIAGIFILAVAVVDLIVWVALRPAMPTILGYAAEREPGIRFLRPYFENYTTIKLIEAVFAAAVIVSAYHFLKLRSWARAAIEATCWLYVIYVVGLACFSFWMHRHLSIDSSAIAARQHERQRLIGGAGVGLLLVAGLVWMILLLRGKKVRAAFAIPPR